MSRELKFKTYHPETKRMSGKAYSWEMVMRFGNKEFIPLQYTGLKDVNGVEIYEGDIIHYKFDGDSYPKEAVDRILTCSYDEDEGMYSFDNSDHSYYWAEIKRHCNIIGNLFENPELLKQ